MFSSTSHLIYSLERHLGKNLLICLILPGIVQQWWLGIQHPLLPEGTFGFDRCTELCHSGRNFRTAWFEKGDFKIGIKNKTLCGFLSLYERCVHIFPTHIYVQTACEVNLASDDPFKVFTIYIYYIYLFILFPPSTDIHIRLVTSEGFGSVQVQVILSW